MGHRRLGDLPRVTWIGMLDSPGGKGMRLVRDPQSGQLENVSATRRERVGDTRRRANCGGLSRGSGHHPREGPV
jgi:hypothetical protein